MNTDCPTWCHGRHVETEDGQPAHFTAVAVRNVTVRVEQTDLESAPRIVLPEQRHLTPRDAHRLAAALVGALAQLCLLYTSPSPRD